MKKTVAVLGATGSVGEQALSVAEARGYRVSYMSAGKNAGRAEQLARRFCPARIAMADEAAARDLRSMKRTAALAEDHAVMDRLAASHVHQVFSNPDLQLPFGQA